jgi:hypothetical protein
VNSLDKDFIKQTFDIVAKLIFDDLGLISAYFELKPS